jgi:Imelysin
LAAAVEQCLTGAQTLRERVVAQDLEGARKAWIASRVGWERSEVFTSGFTSELLEGTAKLAYEIGESKADGGESRFSGTSLDDMRNNTDGIDIAYRLVFASELSARAPALAEATSNQIRQLKEGAATGQPGGYRFGSGARNERGPGSILAASRFCPGVGATLAVGPRSAVGSACYTGARLPNRSWHPRVLPLSFVFLEAQNSQQV